MASATNERQLANARRAAQKALDEDREIYTLIMSKGSGRAWMWRLLTHCQVFNDSDNVDHGVLAFEKGRRSAGLLLLKSVTTLTPEMYVRMTNENSGSKLNSTEQDDDSNAD